MQTVLKSLKARSTEKETRTKSSQQELQRRQMEQADRMAEMLFSEKSSKKIKGRFAL